MAAVAAILKYIILKILKKVDHKHVSYLFFRVIKGQGIRFQSYLICLNLFSGIFKMAATAAIFDVYDFVLEF